MMNSIWNERIKFNVGGTLFETTRSTVEKLGSEYFAILLNPNSGFTQPQDGIYFIDRDPDYFRVILNIARYDNVFLDDKKVTLELLEREATFYLLGDFCRSLIASYKDTNSTKTKRSVGKDIGDTGSKLDVRLDLTVDDFTTSKSEFLYHHARLKKSKGRKNFICNINPNCLLALEPLIESVECCRCMREVIMSPSSELVGWCHRCRRCLRCTETICMPIRL